MVGKYFGIPFAESGDKEAVPDASVNTLVSYETGYTPEYELDPDVDPNGNYIGRQRFNQILNDATGAIKEIQERGYKVYAADVNYPAGSYTIGSDDEIYKSTAANGPDTSVVNPVGDGSGTWVTSAASREVTTSPTDATAGRLTKVGDFGLGAGAGTNQPVLSDINVDNPTGIYYCTDTTAGTPVAEFGQLFHVQRASSPSLAGATQTYVSVNSNRMWFRRAAAGIWQPWQEILKSADVTSSSTDTTAGRLTKVGDYSLGAADANNISDLNSLTFTQIARYGSTALNNPNAGFGTVFHMQYNSLNFTQLAISTNTDNVYIRKMLNGVIGNWKAVYGDHTAATGTGSLVKQTGASLLGDPTVNTQGNLTDNTTIANTAFVKNVSLGWDQDWLDVTGSRAANTIYTNSTGKPIHLAIVSSNSATIRPVEASPDAVAWVVVGSTGGGSGAIDREGTYIPIPNGWSYRINGSVDVLESWAELR